MGQTRKRNSNDGRPRYTAYYVDVAGRRRSAGTFATKREADRAWQRAGSKVAEGRVGDVRRSRQRFRRNVEDEWLPNHVMELTTRQSYTYQLRRRILPAFGDYPMVEILPSHIREYVTRLQREGVHAHTIRYCVTILSAIFTTALNDQVTFLHPCKGVRTPAVAKKSRPIITPEQFEVIHSLLPDATSKLLVETAIESGPRWGEITELRKRDFDPTTRVLTVSRVVVELSGLGRVDDKRFMIKPYPKDQEWRQVSLSRHISDQLLERMEGLDADDLLFRAPEAVGQVRRRPDVLPDPATLLRDQAMLRARGIAAVIPEPADQAGHRKNRGSRDGRPVGRPCGHGSAARRLPGCGRPGKSTHAKPDPEVRSSRISHH